MNPDKSVVDGNGKENIMSENLMSLNRLTMDDIDFSDARETLEKMKQTEKEYQIKYGDEWWEHYLADTNPSYGMVTGSGNFRCLRTCRFLNVFHRSYVMHLISRMRKRSI